jgi:hypothetical protein
MTSDGRTTLDTVSNHFVSASTTPNHLAEATVHGLREQDDQFWICGHRGTRTSRKRQRSS